MTDMDAETSDKLAVLQRYTEQLFVVFFKRLAEMNRQQPVTEADRVRLAREMTQNANLLLETAEAAGCQHSPDHGFPLDLRSQHFKRFMLNQLMMACKNAALNKDQDTMRQWLLTFITSIEIAVGQYRFQEAQCACDHWIETLKSQGTFSYSTFMHSNKAMSFYVLIMFQLAVFLQGKPNQRINWLIQSMKSTPTSRVEQGVILHHIQPIQPPSRPEVVAIFTAIYQQLRQYIIQHDMSAYIAEKYPQLNLEPIHLLNNLLHEIALLEYPPKQ